MPNSTVILLVIAALIGLAIGVERKWRGFTGSAPLHVAPALFGAYLVTRQSGFTALSWFLPLQILMWLIVIATVCMWSAERTPDNDGAFRGTGGIGLSWTLAFLLGAICAFQAWVLLACACVGLVIFGLRTPRRVSAVAPAVPAASIAAVSLPGEPLEESGSGEAVGGANAGGDLKSVDGDAGGAAEPAIDGAAVKAARDEPLLHRPAA